MPREVWVESADDSNDTKVPAKAASKAAAKVVKTRSFKGVVFATTHADGIWSTGQAAKETVRPLFSIVGADEAEAGALIANLRLGRKFGDRPPDKKADRYKYTTYEFARSADYRWKMQRHPEGTLCQVFQPDMYAADPGMVDPKECTFALLPALTWLDAYPLDIDAMVAHCLNMMPGLHGELTERNSPDMLALAKIAPLWLVYLDRRTTCPLVPEPTFALQLLLGALHNGYATRGASMDSHASPTWGRGHWSYKEEGLADMKLAVGIVTHVDHKLLEPFLADHVARYYDAMDKRGSTATVPVKKARAGRGQVPMKHENAAFRVGDGHGPAVDSDD